MDIEIGYYRLSTGFYLYVGENEDLLKRERGTIGTDEHCRVIRVRTDVGDTGVGFFTDRGLFVNQIPPSEIKKLVPQGRFEYLESIRIEAMNRKDLEDYLNE